MRYHFTPVRMAIIKVYRASLVGHAVKNPPAYAGDAGLISDLGRSHMLQSI